MWWGLCSKALDRFPADKMRFYDFRGIIRGHVGVKNAVRLDDGYRPLLAEAVASGKIHANVC